MKLIRGGHVPLHFVFAALPLGLCLVAPRKQVNLLRAGRSLASGSGALNATLSTVDYESMFASFRRDMQLPNCSMMGGLVLPNVSARCCFSVQVATQRALSEYGMAQPCKGAWRCKADGVTPEAGFEEHARKDVCAEPSCLHGVTNAMKANWKTAKAAKYMDTLCDAATVSSENGAKAGLLRATLDAIEGVRRRRRRGLSENKTKDRPACFPGEALVEVLGRGSIPMASLRTGDLVLTAEPKVGASPEYAPVLDWIHIAKGVEASFTTIYHERGILRASPGHLVFAASATGKDQYIDMAAGMLQKGDIIFAAADTDSTENGLVPSRILAIDHNSVSSGMYAPLTRTGTILVDGVLASNYATPSLEVRLPHWLAHAGLFPVRAFHSLGLAKVFAVARTILFGDHAPDSTAEVADVVHPYCSFLYHGLHAQQLLRST